MGKHFMIGVRRNHFKQILSKWCKRIKIGIKLLMLTDAYPINLGFC